MKLNRVLGGLVLAAGALTLSACNDSPHVVNESLEVELGANCSAMGGMWYFLEYEHYSDGATHGRYVCEFWQPTGDYDQSLPEIEIYSESLDA